METAGTRRLVEECEGNLSLGELLAALARRFRGSFEEIMNEKGEVSFDTTILVNGEIVRDVNIQLRDGDAVAIFAAVAGG